jgi:glycosyltransferase
MRISVVTTCRNAAPTLQAALESVRVQQGVEVEHIVVDGKSTDGTLDVVAAHGPHVAKLISEPDSGIYDGLNKGVRAATGDVIGFVHADDALAHPGVLHRIAKLFDDPSIDAVYGDLVYVDRDRPEKVLRYWKAGSYSRLRLLKGWMPPHPTLYMRRQVYERFGLFDTRFRIAADYEQMLRVLWHGRIRAAYVPEVLVRMRAGGASNGSLPNMLRKLAEDFQALRQNGISPAQALLLKNVTKLPQFVARPPVALWTEPDRTPV